MSPEMFRPIFTGLFQELLAAAGFMFVLFCSTHSYRAVKQNDIIRSEHDAKNRAENNKRR